MKRRALLLGAAALAVAAQGCAGPEVAESTLGDAAGLPSPARILVLDFAVTPDEVQLDSSIAARVRGSLEATPLATRQLAIARQVAAAVADAVVAELRAQGIAAERVAGALGASARNELLVEGQLKFADQGNATERRLIGFGAGRSQVGVDSQLYFRHGNAAPKALEDFAASVASPRTPGLAEGLGAGALAGRLVDAAVLGGGAQAFTETERSSVAAEAEAVGRELGKRIAAYLAQRGWHPAA